MTFHHAFRYQQIIQPVFTDFDVKKKFLIPTLRAYSKGKDHCIWFLYMWNIFLWNMQTGSYNFHSSYFCQKCWYPKGASCPWIIKRPPLVVVVVVFLACVLHLPPEEMVDFDTTSGWDWEPAAFTHLCLQPGNSFPGCVDGALLQRTDRSPPEWRLWFLQKLTTTCFNSYPSYGLFTVTENYFQGLQRQRWEDRGGVWKGEESHPPLFVACTAAAENNSFAAKT